MAQTVARVFNPLTGVFGSGNVQFFPGAATTQTYTWAVPPGVDAVRVRLWGGGGYGNGCGGGFALKTIYGISGTPSIVITVGTGGATGAANTTGGTTSFGSFVSATGGSSSNTLPGAGVGGDVNYTGGLGGSAGGGAAGLFGNGGSSNASSNGGNGNAGAGSAGARSGGHGFLGASGINTDVATFFKLTPTSGLENTFSIDFIGTGGGGAIDMPGINGGGGSGIVTGTNTANDGGYPGGGMGNFNTITTGRGGSGLVIVEW